MSIYEECVKDIQIRFEQNDGEVYEEEKDMTPLLTRANSIMSFHQVLFQYDNLILISHSSNLNIDIEEEVIVNSSKDDKALFVKNRETSCQ